MLTPNKDMSRDHESSIKGLAWRERSVVLGSAWRHYKKSEEAAASPKDFKVRVCSFYSFGSLAASPQDRGLDSRSTWSTLQKKHPEEVQKIMEESETKVHERL